MEYKRGALFAALEYYQRDMRYSHPDGKFDSGKWYPADTESCDCCKSIRAPSRSYPFSFMTHCRTLKHVANLYLANPTEVRAHLKKFKGIIVAVSTNKELKQIFSTVPVTFTETDLKGLFVEHLI